MCLLTVLSPAEQHRSWATLPVDQNEGGLKPQLPLFLMMGIQFNLSKSQVSVCKVRIFA